jgi:LuxR family maltose regulon positive regulatory protein
MTTPLLTTKLHIPSTPPKLVERPRLIERLNEGLYGRGGRFARELTLVSAPAGSGKTTLVTAWLSGSDRPATWLSLDESDNDPARFFAYLVAALQRVEAGIGQAAQAMLQAPQPPLPQSLLTTLINDIAATPHPFVLVLDDYHLIHTLPIHQQIALLLEHQPPQMHLVIATREDPPLPLSRLRARGQIAEVRQTDLRFTPEETADFLRRAAHRGLSSADVAVLHRRTEGWIAGLQLLALSIRDSDDVQRLVTSFTGSHRYVLDYLIEEVFGQQPPEVQDFLLKTSILDRFTAPLCAALTDTQRGNSRKMLLALEQANLFIVPLDESRRWYRYHRLFADLLRHRLELGQQVDVVQLHRRASQWYADNDFPADAIHHALAACDWERAAELITDASGSLLKRGEMVTLLGWYRQLPEEVVRANPALCIEFSWPLILTDQIDAAEPYLAQAEEVARKHNVVPLLGGIAIARAHIARARGDNAGVIELSEQALALLPPDELSGRSIVALNLGMAQWFRGRLAEARQALAEAQRTARGSGNEYARWTASIFLGRIEAAQGNLRRAAESCRQMIRQGGQSPIVSLAHYDLGRLLYEWNDLEAAADHLQQGIELARRGGGVEFEAGGYSTLAFIRQARGDSTAARETLHKAIQLLENPSISPSTRLYNLASQVTIALGRGDLDAASRVVQRFPTLEDAESFPDYLLLMLARARVLLAQGQRAAAAVHLEGLHRLASGAGWQTTATQARALQALAAPTPDEALAFLTESLTLAEPAGYVRTFLDAGEPMAALLRQAVSRGTGTEYADKVLAAFEGETKDERRKTKETPASFVVRPSSLVEPLSERELDVLHLLAERQTNQEIAHALCVSVNTVKTHLKNIYGKLGVNNRRQAVATATELDLLPRP